MGGEAIAILDFGGQYCHLIARRVRELGVYTEVLEGRSKIGRLIGDREVKGIVLSGGPMSVYERGAPKVGKELLSGGLPVLGICYGHQLIAHLSGGKVARVPRREYGVVEATILKPFGVLENFGPKEKVWMSHSDAVVEVPNEYEVLARTESCPIAAMMHKEKPIYGLQWHPEVSHTERGIESLGNFVFKVCGCSRSWSSVDRAGSAVQEIRKAVGRGRAIVALSGGVDSSTAAVLASKAIGGNLTAVFVDHGFMREGEPESIKETFLKLGVRVKILRAKKRFMRRIS
ncbi:MAG: glutamine-hydrolyzing GMP synthase, partial [Thermoproteota archaeon]